MSKQLYQPRNPVLKCELLYVPGRGKAVQAGEQAEEIFVKAVIDRLGRKGERTPAFRQEGDGVRRGVEAGKCRLAVLIGHVLQHDAAALRSGL